MQAEQDDASWLATLTAVRLDKSSGLVAHSGHARRTLTEHADDDEPRPHGRFQPQQVVEVLQEGDGYDGSAFVADLLTVEDEEAQVLQPPVIEAAALCA